MPTAGITGTTRRKGKSSLRFQRLAEILAKESRFRVLDFGCGTGRHTLYFARKDFQVYGFDGYGKAVERARELLKDAGLKADLAIHDMLEPLPYPDRSFDLVIATRVIHHTLVANIRKMVAEINRVLKMGGQVFLQVPEYSDHAWVLAEGMHAHRVLEPGTHAPIEGIEKDVPHHCFTREDLLGLFGNFEAEEIHAKSDHYGGFCFVARKVRE